MRLYMHSIIEHILYIYNNCNNNIIPRALSDQATCGVLEDDAYALEKTLDCWSLAATEHTEYIVLVHRNHSSMISNNNKNSS